MVPLPLEAPASWADLASMAPVTKTKKNSHNTGARANSTLEVTRLPHRGCAQTRNVDVAARSTRANPRAQALLRGRAWVAQLWAKSVGAVRLRALPFSLVQQGCLRFGVSRCGPAAAVVGRGC